MKIYSIDLRERVFKAWQSGEETQREIAKRFSVTDRWIRLLVKQYKEKGHIRLEMSDNFGRKPAFDNPARAKLVEKVKQEPDLTLEQLRQWSEDELGIVCSHMSVDRALRKEKITYKKNSQGKRTR